MLLSGFPTSAVDSRYRLSLPLGSAENGGYTSASTRSCEEAVMFKLKTFLVKERVGILKLQDVFDIYDPETGVQVGVAKENVNVVLKLLRLVVNKRLLPT